MFSRLFKQASNSLYLSSNLLIRVIGKTTTICSTTLLSDRSFKCWIHGLLQGRATEYTYCVHCTFLGKIMVQGKKSWYMVQGKTPMCLVCLITKLFFPVPCIIQRGDGTKSRIPRATDVVLSFSEDVNPPAPKQQQRDDWDTESQCMEA